MNEQTAALFEAHVAHELSALAARERDDSFERLTRTLFEWFSTVKLTQLLTAEQVLGVIDRYVIELRISGGITELVGQLAQTAFTSDANDDTRVDQLLSYESYRDFADKIQSLEGAFQEIVLLITRARSFRPLLVRAVVVVASTFLFGSADQSKPTGHAGKLSQLGRELRTALVGRLEGQLNNYLEQHAEDITLASEARVRELLKPDAVRSLADELWDAVGEKRLSELYSLLSPTDMEDFVVLVYESWLKYRHTPYFRAICQQVVAALYEKYGNESALLLLDDMGIDDRMVAHELRVLVAPMFAEAARTGVLEQQVRARLEPFYRSDVVASLLKQPAD